MFILLDVMLRRIVRRGDLTFIDASGLSHRYGDGAGPPVVVRVKERRVEWHLVLDPQLALGESYMDFTTVDVSGAPTELARRGAWVEVMGARVTVDDLTDRAGTIGYELLTRLGQRVHRVYEGA